MKQEEYIMWLYEKLKNKTYKHGGYTVFYITEPKVRKIEKSRYIDRIVHRWVVDNFLVPYFVPTFINTTYACLKGRGMYKACLDVQKAMLHCRGYTNFAIISSVFFNIVIKKHCFLIYFKIVVGSFYRNFAISLNVIS